MLDTNGSVAGIIAQKRAAMGLNQREFAQFLGLREGGERTVGGWERGEHTPSKSKMQLIRSLPENIPFKTPQNVSTKGGDFRFIDLFAGIGGIRLPFQ